jgi:hypothetical protein
MNRICKVTCLALLMNALHGFSQEGVRYRTVQAGGLNICDRELHAQTSARITRENIHFRPGRKKRKAERSDNVEKTTLIQTNYNCGGQNEYD